MVIRVLSMLTVVLLAGACGLFDSGGEEDCPIGMFDPVLGCTEDTGRDITVRMTNGDTEAVHLFLGLGETFPCCRVEPGATREVVYQAAVGGQLYLTAGRNGTMFNTRVCTVTQAHFDSRSFVVSWNGNWSC